MVGVETIFGAAVPIVKAPQKPLDGGGLQLSQLSHLKDGCPRLTTMASFTSFLCVDCVGDVTLQAGCGRRKSALSGDVMGVVPE